MLQLCSTCVRVTLLLCLYCTIWQVSIIDEIKAQYQNVSHDFSKSTESYPFYWITSLNLPEDIKISREGGNWLKHRDLKWKSKHKPNETIHTSRNFKKNLLLDSRKTKRGSKTFVKCFLSPLERVERSNHKDGSSLWFERKTSIFRLNNGYFFENLKTFFFSKFLDVFHGCGSKYWVFCVQSNCFYSARSL